MSRREGSSTAREERDKLEKLFWQHAPGALHLAFLLTGDRHVAEDVTQDAFVRVAGRFQEILRPDAFGTYLKRTVVNLTRDHFRRVRRERMLLLRHERLSDGPLQEPESVRIEAGAELIHALRKLPHRQRAAVVLRYCEGLSEHEVAEALDTTLSASKSLTSRGLTALRKDLEAIDNA